MADEILTVEDASKILKVHPQTVRKLIREKKLKAFYVGTQLRIRRADLDDFMRGGQQ